MTLRFERQKAGRRYKTRHCTECDRVISEGAWSGRDGNWKRHLVSKAHEARVARRLAGWWPEPTQEPTL